jgi:ABC-type transport system involved in cytochrome bd biosynthesis fused ATPase/permease subunit
MLIWNVARAVQTGLLDAPTRRALHDFVARASGLAPAPDEGAPRPGPPDVRHIDVTFDHVSVVHAGASRATPRDVSYRWEPDRGLAITGVNGAGKSTLALVLLGLVECTEGRIAIGGVALDDMDPAALRRKMAYVAQGGFVSPGSTVGWHLGLFAENAPETSRSLAVLDRVGLLDVLRSHVTTADGDVLLVPAGTLSGGERQRMLLARALLQDAELMILDEPEVALDAAGRTWLRHLLEEVSLTCRVLVIAHDLSIVPASFARLELERGDLVGRALAAE